MINLEIFKKIILDIKNQETKDEKLSKLLLDDGCGGLGGWVSTANTLIDDLLMLLVDMTNDQHEYISWWMYEAKDGNKFVYEDIDNTTERVFDLNSLDDLYYYIIGEYEKVKQYTQPKKERKTYTQTCSIHDILGNFPKPDISNVELK